ncbi:nucleotide-binding universal stress UspA family protein [Gillisia mitskevichiae]|uniref:Nucleotide-binding universal stress UspA family protein n=1 Tax=Gillisia mitskevichiae TaxID=270921 RepID=A0A495PVC5_9FLAO|nr:universal stress protein [Gillisia mitskevichiae]RKS53730.1 nucleotide-binding universal stress UspA family protein [Gillisia mitskevichiae]
MNKILIPTDFSANAMNAIKYALQLFKNEQSNFYIIHTFADEVYDNHTVLTRALFEEFRDIIKKKSEKQLGELLMILKETYPNPKHHFEAISKFGNLVDEVNHFVDNEKIDVVVMGTRGRTDNRSIDFGSNTLQVIKYIKCPVLAIPKAYTKLNLQKMLFPTNYLVPLKRKELKLVSNLSKIFKAQVKFLYISKSKKLSFRQQDNKESIKHMMAGNNTQFIEGEGEDLIKMIHDEIEKEKIDMLIMVNSRKSYLESLLYPSTVQKLGLQIQIPFLVLQNF